jgi:hypothetical protein
MEHQTTISKVTNKIIIRILIDKIIKVKANTSGSENPSQPIIKNALSSFQNKEE